jgi:hypothetical protein
MEFPARRRLVWHVFPRNMTSPPAANQRRSFL